MTEYPPQDDNENSLLMRKRDRHYPQLKGTPWACQWTGQIGVTSTRILRVQLLAPGFNYRGFNHMLLQRGTLPDNM